MAKRSGAVLVSRQRWFDSPLGLSFPFKSLGLLTLSCDFASHIKGNIKIRLYHYHSGTEINLVVNVTV